MEGKNLKKWNIIIMLLSAIIIVVCGLSCFQNIKASLRKQEISSLRDVANQNAIVIEKALEARLDFLESIATMMRTENMVNDEQILKVLKDVPKVYGLKRIGFVRPDGTAFTTDGYEQNLSFREFFAHSMNGNRYIANRLLDRMGKSGYINVFSVPVFSKKDSRVVGVLFSTYDTAKFGKIIDVPSFDNNGYCIIIDDNGYVIADSEKSPMAG
ncbi:MAG: cache domain-containing protein, partial [Phascolarctobacterium sp.]|nr:cache domain-containing protein [Phascolarctobacterium sp.]